MLNAKSLEFLLIFFLFLSFPCLLLALFSLPLLLDTRIDLLTALICHLMILGLATDTIRSLNILVVVGRILTKFVSMDETSLGISQSEQG